MGNYCEKVQTGVVIENPISNENCVICLEQIFHSDKMDNLKSNYKLV